MSPTSQWGSSSRSAFLVWGRTKARWRLRLTHDICDSCRMSWQTLQIIRSHPRNAPWGRTWRRFWKQCRWCRPRSGEAHLVLCASLQPFLFFLGLLHVSKFLIAYIVPSDLMESRSPSRQSAAGGVRAGNIYCTGTVECVTQYAVGRYPALGFATRQRRRARES